MGRFKKLVESEEVMEKFFADYKIPSNVGLRYCKRHEAPYAPNGKGLP